MQETILSVIIPYYQETPEEIFPLLAGLNSQLGIDFSTIECILVNDGGQNKLSEDFLALFEELSIRMINRNENGGPGAARQTGLDACAGDYVMFCDADDVLHNVLVLEGFLREIEQNRPEMIASTWLVERYDEAEDKYEYIAQEMDFTWMHGKVFNREFLRLKGISFHESLRVHEDTYFLKLVFAEASDVRKLLMTSYVWRYRPQSITRRNDEDYTFNSMAEFIKSVGYALEKIEKAYPEQMRLAVVQFVTDIYFFTHQQRWLVEEKRKLREIVENAFCDRMKAYIKYYREAPVDLLATVYNQERVLFFADQMETETLNEWLKRIRLQAS